MKCDVIKRLEALGCIPDEGDEWLLSFVIQKVTSHILSYCALSAIPKELHETAVDMAAGEFLRGKRASGELGDLEILSSDGVSSIKLGDTQVSFKEGKSPADELDSLISYLTRGFSADLAAYRCFKW